MELKFLSLDQSIFRKIILPSLKFGNILKKRLLKKFKSIKNLKGANLADLMTVQGINEKMAKLILKKLK